jgi:hypothetical protein
MICFNIGERIKSAGWNFPLQPASTNKTRSLGYLAGAQLYSYEFSRSDYIPCLPHILKHTSYQCNASGWEFRMAFPGRNIVANSVPLSTPFLAK